MQQINLYQAEFKKEKIIVSAVQVAQVSAVVVAVLLLITGGNVWQTSRLQSSLNQTEATRLASQKELEQSKQLYAKKQENPVLVKQVEKLTMELNTKKQVLKVLSGKSFGNTRGFVEHFTGLAKQRIDGMWLTNISIREGGTSLGMKGTATRPEYVPQYLQRLSAESAFVGTEFKTFLLAQSEKKKRWVDFDLQSIVEVKTQ